MKPIVILITGYAHSGKDTAGNYLVKKYIELGYNVRKVALADRLKLITQRLIKLFYNVEISIDEFYDQESKEKIRDNMPHTLRTLLQQIGSEIFRDILWKNIWCDIVSKELSDITIITDIRFDSELQYFLNLYNEGILNNCITIRIDRQRHLIMQHQSEANIESLAVKHVIDNNQDLDHLYAQLDNIF